MNAELLTDKELYSWLRSQELAPHLKRIVEEEFKRRQFPIEVVDKLSMDYEGVNAKTNSSLTAVEECLIILLPFFPVIHAILANRHISKGNPKKWKQYWRFVTIGYAVWTVIALVIARIIFANRS